MINRLEIRHFKSIKNLELDCKRVNVFIGEPNTGKSNILEALGLLSWSAHRRGKTGKKETEISYYQYSVQDLDLEYEDASGNRYPGQSRISELHEFIRYKRLDDIFFQADTTEPIQISIEDTGKVTLNLAITHGKGKITVESDPQTKKTASRITLDNYGHGIGLARQCSEFDFIKYYHFKNIVTFPDQMADFLLPPTGRNLFSVIVNNKKIRDDVKDLFNEVPFEFVLDTAEHQINFQKKKDNITYSFPYIIASDTLRHIAFYLVALESNQRSTLVFEEPEAHAFPYYVKWLGERIALYSADNQFFIVTHNPYLISALMEKTTTEDLNVVVTYMKDNQTQTYSLTDDEIRDIMGFDPFFNITSFIPEG
ncbi:MAG: AAA family ATPase [Methanomicrobiales archaeon]